MERFTIRVCITYEFKLQKAYVNIVKVFGEDVVTIRSIQTIYKKIRSGNLTFIKKNVLEDEDSK